MEEDLKTIFNDIWKYGIPEGRKKGTICPIFKKGDKDEAKNYRPITLMDSGYKLYTNMLGKMLKEEIEER